MASDTQIRDIHRGARFVRADLHIHSFGASPDVEDPSMTPEAIVATAHSLNLSVIAITDHNNTSNVQKALDAAKKHQILVVPGIELSTPGGHLLVYSPTLDKLNRIVGKLSFNDTKTSCRTSMADILAIVESFDSIAIPAHIDGGSGLEKVNTNYGDAKEAVITSSVLVGLEIKSKDAVDWYTDDDPNSARRSLLKKRFEKLSDPFLRAIPKIQSSDAHRLSQLGRNAADNKKLTRLKMSALDWTAFRAAFADPESRVRLEVQIPERTRQFIGMRISGGFLDGQTFGFSPNLTCIIGGRGSGKSTAISALRAIAGKTPSSGVDESEAWPERVDVLYVDELGTEHELRLDGQGAVSDASDPFGSPPIIDLNSFEQGEVAKTIEKCGKEPTALLKFLDDLIPHRSSLQEIDDYRDSLQENSRELSKLDTALLQYNTIKEKLGFKKHQQEAAKKAKSEDLITYQSKLAAAIALRDQILPTFGIASTSILDSYDDEILSDLRLLSTSSASITPSGATNPLPDIIKSLSAAMSNGKKSVAIAIREATPQLKKFVVTCRKRQSAYQAKVDEEATKLRAKGISLDLRFLTELAAEVQKTTAKLASLENMKLIRTQLLLQRTSLLKKFHAAHSDRFDMRVGLAKSLQRKLKHFLVDWNIGLTFSEARLSPGAEDALKDVMEWRTSAAPKAPRLVGALGVPAILGAVENKDSAILNNARDTNGDPILTLPEAQQVIERLSKFEYRRQLEESQYADFPRIILSRPVLDIDENPTGKVVSRNFGQLSLGQQQSIILAILLSVDDGRPLLLDQPEDNLDSAFIFQILVKALRRIKETRQVIIVTHNANIAVLGDSDLVIPLKATAERGQVRHAGTVEQPRTRELICEILEGGSAAYKKRGELYGVS